VLIVGEGGSHPVAKIVAQPMPLWTLVERRQTREKALSPTVRRGNSPMVWRISPQAAAPVLLSPAATMTVTWTLTFR